MRLSLSVVCTVGRVATTHAGFPPVQSCLAQAAFSGARFRRPGAEIAAWRRSCLAGLEPNSPALTRWPLPGLGSSFWLCRQSNLQFKQHCPLSQRLTFINMNLTNDLQILPPFQIIGRSTFLISSLTSRFIQKKLQNITGLLYQYKILKNDLNLTMFV